MSTQSAASGPISPCRLKRSAPEEEKDENKDSNTTGEVSAEMLQLLQGGSLTHLGQGKQLFVELRVNPGPAAGDRKQPAWSLGGCKCCIQPEHCFCLSTVCLLKKALSLSGLNRKFLSLLLTSRKK